MIAQVFAQVLASAVWAVNVVAQVKAVEDSVAGQRTAALRLGATVV